MTQTTRSLVMRITADASQAEREVDDLTRKISNADSFSSGRAGFSGSIAGNFDADSFNSNARESVGALGDLDSALQTFGSITGTTSAQIAGDAFALGEAAVQVGGALPAVASKFLSLSPALLGAGAAAGVLTLAVSALVAESQQAAQENTNAFNSRISARQKALEFEQMTDEQRAERAKELQSKIAIIEEETNQARIDRELQWQEAVQSSVIFGDLLARVSQAVGKDTRITEDAIIAQEESAKAMKEELDVLMKVTPAVNSVTNSFDSGMTAITASMSKTQNAANEFSNALKTTEDTFKGVTSGIALTAKTIQNGRIVSKVTEQAQQVTQDRQQIIDDNQRMYEQRLNQIKDYERRKFEIEQDYRKEAWLAERSNDVIAYQNAGAARQSELSRANSGMVINFNNPNLGTLATQQDFEMMKGDVTNLLVEVVGARKGMY